MGMAIDVLKYAVSQPCRVLVTQMPEIVIPGSVVGKRVDKWPIAPAKTEARADIDMLALAS